MVTRSPHKFQDVKPTTTVVETQLDEEEKLKEAFTGCDGVISALGDDRKKRPKTHYLPHVWNAMKAAGVTKYIGMASGAMMMPGEKRGGFQRTVHPLLSVLKLFGVDLLEQNEWERDSLLMGKNGADGITWVITRVVRPTKTPFVGAYVHQDKRGPMNCSIYDHGDFCLYLEKQYFIDLILIRFFISARAMKSTGCVAPYFDFKRREVNATRANHSPSRSSARPSLYVGATGAHK